MTLGYIYSHLESCHNPIVSVVNLLEDVPFLFFICSQCRHPVGTGKNLFFFPH